MIKRILIAIFLLSTTATFAAVILKSTLTKVAIVPPAPPETGMPAWRQGMTVGQWKQIPGSTLANVPITNIVSGNYGPAAKVGAWQGFALDTRDSSVYSVAGGGHHDYAGNEVDKIKLSDDAPLWREVRVGTPMKDIIEGVEYYNDKKPTSRHSWYGITFDESSNRAMLFSGAYWGSGGATMATDGYNVLTNDYDPDNTYPDVPNDFMVPQGGTALTEHGITNNVYILANYYIWTYNVTSKLWTRLRDVPYPTQGHNTATAIDTNRNRMMILGGDTQDKYIYNINDNSLNPINLTGFTEAALAAIQAILNEKGAGFVYEPAIDAFLFRTQAAGGAVYKINAKEEVAGGLTFKVEVLTTSGGSSIPVADANNGVWRRFLYVPKLKGVFYCPAYNSNMWFLRTN